jgi:crossover junction endodeoxyribonuclease RuvC
VRILGIDPGYGRLGWSVVDKNLKLIDYGVIETASDKKIDERILDIHNRLTEIITLHKPRCAAIEKLFFIKNVTTGIDVAKTIGAVILTLRLHGIGYHEYTPTQVKQAVTGYGRAGKEQVKFMMKSIFKLKELPTPDDASDALAIALCHSLRSDFPI